ncbi:unnamed protein product [Bursaphelenchus xylophilus]|uniref:(pine wood nematode) hypothetical protein n=1 Tax=Bursaphelenchus xylophilus TaxID=6326 RepID=A0A1I7S5T3_BURXY|nr:unnamed protein product [Bursaphelenchus xylophilus]CAG9125041.1 unnamed protein product [Bursaphelenchus xylophilus]
MCSRNKAKPCPPITKDNVLEVLEFLYDQKVAPMEKRHVFEQFHNPPLRKGEFISVPLVLFLGQYSVGKTTMIKYLLGQEYPGSRIGPDPTTDTFTVVHYGEKQHEVMGATLMADPSLPFQCLSTFGSTFSTRIRGAALNSGLLKHMTLIDTPGILSGEKHTSNRGYDFATVSRFIADKVDLIILLFDISRLDISEEFKIVLQNIKGNEEKIKIILNKADSVDTQHLTRVRGALMWMLSKVISTPEVPRVYICSFSDEIAANGIPKRFHADYKELFEVFQRIPAKCMDRKVNDIIKRAKQVKIHALIMSECMRGWYRKNQRNLQGALKGGKLTKIFHNVRIQSQIPESYMPLQELFQQRGLESNVAGWNKLDKKMMEQLQEFIDVDIPNILKVMEHNEDPTESLRNYFHDLKSPLHRKTPKKVGSSSKKAKNVEKVSKKEEKIPEKPAPVINKAPPEPPRAPLMEGPAYENLVEMAKIEANNKGNAEGNNANEGKSTGPQNQIKVPEPPSGSNLVQTDLQSVN